MLSYIVKGAYALLKATHGLCNSEDSHEMGEFETTNVMILSLLVSGSIVVTVFVNHIYIILNLLCIS